MEMVRCIFKGIQTQVEQEMQLIGRASQGVDLVWNQ